MNSVNAWLVFYDRHGTPEHNHFRETVMQHVDENECFDGTQVMFLSEMSYGVKDGKRYVTYRGETLFEGDERIPDVVFVRDSMFAPVMHFESMGMTCMPSSRQIMIASDKAVTTSILAGIVPMPDTACVLGTDCTDKPTAYPVVAKIHDGSCGDGVYKCGDEEELEQARGDIPWDKTLIQECMPTGVDVRVYMQCGKVTHAVKRIPPEKSFKANICSGGVAECYVLTDEERHMAERIADTMSGGEPLGLIAIDFLFDENGKFTLCEVNTSPGVKGMAQSYGVDAMDIIGGYLHDAVECVAEYNARETKIGGTD